MKTVVSVTPLAVERDSRTYKQATSLARLGYRSIVFEALPSGALPAELPFELVTLGGRQAAPAAAAAEPAVDAAPAIAGGASNPAPAPRRTPLDALADALPSGVRRVAAWGWAAHQRTRRGYYRTKFALRTRAARARQRSTPLVFLTLLRDYVRKIRATAAQMPGGDLYCLHAPFLFPAVWWRARGRSAVVYDAHDLYAVLRHDGRPLTAADRGMWAIWDAVEHRAARRASACTTVGDGVADAARARFGRSFTVVRNAHDRRLDATGVPGVRERFGLSDDDVVLAVSGNYKRVMAVESLLDALAALDDRVHAVFFGADYAGFPERAAGLGLDGRAHFHEAVAPTHIVPSLLGADLAPILYTPATANVSNALPNGFFHAVAAGVPVLYPRGLPELAGLCARLQLGWEIDPERPAALAAAIQARLDAPDEVERCRAAVVRAREELSWEREERAFADVVAAALGS
jgi:glycosyltransferase involved in cell wall biosynthesis